MDKVTLDFENGIVEWNNEYQKGTEHCPDLAKHKGVILETILEAMGYATYDISAEVDLINKAINEE